VLSELSESEGRDRWTESLDADGRDRWTESLDADGRDRWTGSLDADGRDRWTESLDADGRDRWTGSLDAVDCIGRETKSVAAGGRCGRGTGSMPRMLEILCLTLIVGGLLGDGEKRSLAGLCPFIFFLGEDCDFSYFRFVPGSSFFAWNKFAISKSPFSFAQVGPDSEMFGFRFKELGKSSN